jgi:predicted esterase
MVSDPVTACPGGYGAQPPEEGWNDGFESAGQDREFYLFLPDEGVEGPRPILIAFNGTGEDGQSFSSRAHLTDFRDRGFIVAAPSSNGNGAVWPVWDGMRQAADLELPNADLDYFDELLACLAGHFSVDVHRVYIAGHSAGGIFTNHVLQRRADVVAGAIVASGVFSLTSPAGDQELDEAFALITWGGDDDAYSGSAEGVEVPQINFVEQASLASIFYDEQPNVGQANCHADVGHAWLSMINDWMIDLLLEHPDGLPGAAGLELPALPFGSSASCTTEPFVFVPPLQVECGESSVAGCYEFCQLTADCGVENPTVGPVLEAEINDLGFSGPDNAECAGCLTTCETTAVDAADAPVLACFAAAQASAECGAGIEGAMPLIDGVNDCCAGASESPFCQFVCGTILGNPVAAAFFPECSAIVGG